MSYEIPIWYTNEDGEETELVVEMDVPVRSGNDSFSYNYGSISATHKLPDYLYFDEEPTWNENRYSEEENNAIRSALQKDFDRIYDTIIRTAKALREALCEP